MVRAWEEMFYLVFHHFMGLINSASHQATLRRLRSASPSLPLFVAFSLAKIAVLPGLVTGVTQTLVQSPKAGSLPGSWANGGISW